MIEAVVMIANSIVREAHRKIDTEVAVDTKEHFLTFIHACVLPENVKRVGIAISYASVPPSSPCSAIA
jgi:hypothetical protein